MKHRKWIFFFSWCSLILFLTACGGEKTDAFLSKPMHLQVVDEYLTWNEVKHANGYTVEINDENYETTTNRFSLIDFINEDLYQIRVKALANGDYEESLWSDYYDYQPEKGDSNRYVVTLPQEEGFVIESTDSKDVREGGSYTFSVVLETACDQSSIVVKANSFELFAIDGIYTIADITENQIIAVEGIAINTYIIVYVDDKGFLTEGEAETVVSHNAFLTPPHYVSDDYSLDGWYMDKNYENKWVFEENKVTQNLTLYAKWVYPDEKMVDTTITVLDQLYSGLSGVKSNINLITKDETTNAMIVWHSDCEGILSASGVFTRPYEATKVKLTATVMSGTCTKSVTYLIETVGFKDLSSPIASGYLYTNYALVTDLFFDTLDIIYCAFGLVDDNAEIISNASSRTCLNNIKKYIAGPAHERGDWIVLSIGGGGQSGSFGTIAKSATLRKKFAANLVNLINEYHLDGVDIDWETPTSSESTSFTLLMQEVYQQVKANNPHHLVTAAIAGGMWQPPRYDLPNSIQYMDYVNMMTYGMTNAGKQYHNALYKATPESSKIHGTTLTSCSIAESVIIYKGLHVPDEKILVGLSFYAMRQNYNGTSWVASASSVSYTQIVSDYLTNDNYIEYYDAVCEQPYILNRDKTEFYHYDNPRSIAAKCKFILEQKLGGVMYWQNGQDTTDQLVGAIKTGFGK